jgi:hypothetical protein
MEYSGRALPGRNGKTQKKRKLEEKAVGVSSKRLRREKEKRLKRGRGWEKRWGKWNTPEGLAGMDGKTKDKRKEADKEKTVGEEQRGEGSLISRAYSRCGVRATSKGNSLKCSYPAHTPSREGFAIPAQS